MYRSGSRISRALPNVLLPKKGLGLVTNRVTRNVVYRSLTRIAALLCWVWAAPLVSQTPHIGLVADVDLPVEIHSAADVRWSSDTTVVVADRHKGAVELGISPEHDGMRVLLPASLGPDKPGVWLTSKLSISDQYLAVGSELYQVAWLDRKGTSEVQMRRIEAPLDLDILQDQVLIMGLQRDRSGGFAADGAVAWLGSITDDLVHLKPVHYAASGKDAVAFDHCFPLQVGSVRFHPDGSFLIIPGAEPGAFYYSAEGKLLQTWDTDSLRIYTRCDLTAEQVTRLSAELEARSTWLNLRTVVDDIVLVGDRFGLIVRQRIHGVTTWRLQILRPDGGTDTVPLPVTSPLPGARARGDSRSGKIVLLITDFFSPGGRSLENLPAW